MNISKLIPGSLFLFLCLFGSQLNAYPQQKHVEAAFTPVKILGAKFAKDYQIEFLNMGIGINVDSKREGWDINLKADRHWTLEQARPVIVTMVQEFVTLIYKNPAFRNYLKIAHESMPLCYAAELGPDRLGIKLAFWDKNVDRPLPPYLAQIRVVDGRILYFQANPADQSLQQPPFSETIEEAFARVNRTLIFP